MLAAQKTKVNTWGLLWRTSLENRDNSPHNRDSMSKSFLTLCAVWTQVLNSDLLLFNTSALISMQAFICLFYKEETYSWSQAAQKRNSPSCGDTAVLHDCTWSRAGPSQPSGRGASPVPRAQVTAVRIPRYPQLTQRLQGLSACPHHARDASSREAVTQSCCWGNLLRSQGSTPKHPQPPAS